MEDATARRARDVDRVGAGQVDVAGVEAQPDVGRLEQPIDVLAGRDRHAPVRMERGLEAGVVDDAFEAPEVGEERRPFVRGHVDRRVVAGVMRRRPQHQHLRAGARQLSRGPRHVLELGLDPVRSIEQGRHEAADDAQVELGEVVPELGRIGRQVAVGPELRRGQPALDHLAQDPVPAHQVAPARRTVHAPRDRRARHSFEEIAHVVPDPPLVPPASDVDGQIIVLVGCCAIGCTDREGEPACPDPV